MMATTPAVAPSVGSTPAGRSPASWSMIWLRAKTATVETVRIPIAIISAVAFPALALLFFVVPNDFAQMRTAANEATIQLMVFSLMTTSLFSFGTGIAADRATAWESYVRTLPAGGRIQLAARLLAAVPFAAAGLVPLTVLALVATAFSLTPIQSLACVAALVVGVLPFLFLGFAIGYRFTDKGAIAAVQLVFFPMAFAGGLFIPPEAFPTWLNDISLFLPSRGARDLAVSAAASDPIPWRAALCVFVWMVAMAGLALWAYRRDEGRNYR